MDQNKYLTNSSVLSFDGGDFDIGDNVYAFYLNALVLAGFPIEPIEANEFSREVNGLKVAIGVSNFDNRVTIDYRKRSLEHSPQLPSGAASRILMCYIIYRAKRFNQKRISFGGAFNSLLKQLGIKEDYKPGGNVEQYTKELINLCNSYISVTDNRKDGDKSGLLGENAFIIDSYSLWWDKGFDGDAYVEISEKFFQYVVKKAIPVDWEKIKKIHNSAFKIDLFLWLASKTYAHQNEFKKFSWGEVYRTFGLNYPNVTQFKKKFRYEYNSLVKSLEECEGILTIERKNIILNSKTPLVSKNLLLNKLKKEFE